MHCRIGLHRLQIVNMYAVAMCPECRKDRIIQLETVSTSCPYCGKRTRTKDIIIRFRNEDIGTVRSVFSQATGFSVPEKKKGPDLDPMSTLEYNYGKAKGVDKLICLAEGLTDIKGTFTVGDIESFEPGKGEEIIKRMINAFMVIEGRPGEYSCPKDLR